MAGKVSAKGAVIAVDDSAGTPRTISSDCVSYSINQDAGKLEIEGFGDGSVNFIPGLPVYGVTLDILWDATATTGAKTVLQGILNSTISKTISITPEVGGQTFSGEFMLDALPVSGTPKGELKIGSVNFSVMGTTAPAWA